MPIRTAKDVLNDIKTAEQLVSTPIEEIPRAGAAGWHIAIREAKDSIPLLRKEYRELLLARANGFNLAGPPDKVTEFCNVATKKSNVFVIDAIKVYETLANALEGSLGPSRIFAAQQIEMLAGAVRDVALAAGMTGDLYKPSLKGVEAVHTFDDLVKYVRNLVRDANGDALLVALATKELTDAALAKNCSSDGVGVLIVNATPEEQASLLSMFGNVHDIHLEPDTEIDESFVIYALGGVEPPQKNELSTGNTPEQSPEKKPVGRPRKANTMEIK